MEKVFIPLVLGTNREGRMSERVAKFIISEIEKRDDIETQLFDVAKFDFPKGGYGQDIKDNFPEWRDGMARADGFIIVTPEYNHGYSGDFKKVLDILLPEYKHKAAGIVGVSGGGWGGTRVVEHLMPVLTYMGFSPSAVLNIPTVGDTFGEDGNPIDDVYLERAKGFLNEVVWMAKTLKWGRENL